MMIMVVQRCKNDGGNDHEDDSHAATEHWADEELCVLQRTLCS